MLWLYPELLLAALIPLMLLSGLLVSAQQQKILAPGILFAGIVGSMYLVYDQSLYLSGSIQRSWFLNMITLDGASVLFRLLAGLSGLFAILTAWASPPDKGWKTEFWVFLGTALLGMYLLAISSNLLMVYLSLETISISSYLMTGYMRRESRSAEAGIKYFVYGSVATATFLYGASLLYGISGTLDFTSLQFISALAEQDSAWVWLAFLMVWSALAFKLAAFPFHFWNPDVYEGAPAAVAGFFATGPKITALAVVMRIVLPFDHATVPIEPLYLLALTALITMFAGNTAALTQFNLHRLLAWSGIAHTGYLLAAVACTTIDAKVALVWYAFIYLLANTGAFMAVGIIQNRMGTSDFRDLKGAGPAMAWPALILLICLATLGGLPPTAGFFAKLNLFMAILNTWKLQDDLVFLVLLIGLLINTIIALFYYIRPAAWMFLKSSDKKQEVYILPIQKILLLIPTLSMLLAGILSIGTLADWIFKVIQL